MKKVSVRAPAKVNLSLRILGRRASGFHDLETLFQAIDLCDELTIRPTVRAGVTLEVTGADVGPADDNLVVRAARGFLSAGSIAGGVELRLEKRIPAGAGLGGGTSDAGATLRALDALFPDAVDEARVDSLALELGSDVPFFVGSAGLALGRGRGEVLEPLPPLPEAHLVVACPPVHVATAGAFGALAQARSRGGTLPLPLFARGAPPTTWAEVAAVAVNDFEPTVVRDHPLVGRALEALRATDPVVALLSGSGSAVFAVYADGPAAESACAAASKACRPVRFVRSRTLAALPGLNPRGPST